MNVLVVTTEICTGGMCATTLVHLSGQGTTYCTCTIKLPLKPHQIFRTAAAQLSLYNHFPLRLHFVHNEQVQTSNKMTVLLALFCAY